MKSEQTKKRHARTRRHAFLTMELVLTLPILGIVLLGLFEFSMLFLARGAVVEASRIGARKASLSDATADDVEAEIRKVLEPRLASAMRIEVQLGERTGDVVSVAVHVPMRRATPDLLRPIGFGLRGRTLYSETRMIKE